MKSFLRSVEIQISLDRLLTYISLPTKLLRRLVPPPVYYQPGRKRTYNSAGCIWHLDLSDHVQREIAVNSLAFVRQLTQKLCQHGNIIIDAGANRGNYCIPIAKSFTGALIIYAFEPNPNIYKDLEHHVKQNDILADWLILKDVALGKQSGSITIKQPKSNSGATSAVEEIYGNALQAQFEVSVTTLDSIFQNSNVDFIKIDVEGMDLNVLEGGIKTIQRCHPSIYIEVTKKTVSEIADFLKRQGYDLYLVQDDDHLLVHFSNNRHISWGNLLAAMPEKRHLLSQFISTQ